MRKKNMSIHHKEMRNARKQQAAGRLWAVAVAVAAVVLRGASVMHQNTCYLLPAGYLLEQPVRLFFLLLFAVEKHLQYVLRPTPMPASQSTSKPLLGVNSGEERRL
jgi:hypothetical protein